MRFLCRCGNMLTNQLDPNDTEYYVYSDREWSEFEKRGGYIFQMFHILNMMYGDVKNVIEYIYLKRIRL